MVSGGTLTSVCSCDVCTNEYSPGDGQTKHLPHHHPDPAHHHHHGHHQHGLVETPCDNDKCIMCTPVPLNNNNNNNNSNNSNNNSNSKLSERASDNNNYEEENNGVEPGRPVPPPLPKKTVAPYQVTNTTTSTIAQLRKITQPALTLLLL